MYMARLCGNNFVLFHLLAFIVVSVKTTIKIVFLILSFSSSMIYCKSLGSPIGGCKGLYEESTLFIFIFYM